MSDKPIVIISCITCRSNAPCLDNLYSCVYRQNGLAVSIHDMHDPVCDKWCPAKNDIRLYIDRAKATGND